MEKYSGILLSLSSVPSKFGIGDLGPGCYKFIDYLSKTGCSLWQMLPLGPTGYGNSPYSSLSSMANNPLFISPQMLVKDELLTNKEINKIKVIESRRVNFNKVYKIKMPLINLACKRFLEKEDDDYNTYLQQHSYFLEDYALFKVLAEKFNDNRWYLWPDEYKNRDINTLKEFIKEHKEEIEIVKVQQYFFEKQYKQMKNYANAKNISIIGDIPIFVAKESVDTWINLDLFKTNSDKSFSKVAGVPPDYFTPDGQLWGNPIYNWSRMEENNFTWWTNRIKRLLEFCDIIRIDHFRGFVSCYEIDSNAVNARNGEWVKSPGKQLLQAIEEKLGKLPIIVEDLGYITQEVIDLRESFNFPNMKLLLFGFEFDKDNNINLEHEFLCENYPYNSTCYPGTHDNETIKGFMKNLDRNKRKAIYAYFNTKKRNINKAFIQKLFTSNSKYAIIPMQDILNQGNKYRMNTPSTCNQINWSYKIKLKDLKIKHISYLFNLNKATNRLNDKKNGQLK